jgi:VPDSG-CTERM motif
MITSSRLSLAVLSLVALIGGISLRADSVIVSEIGVGANETVWINSSNLGGNLHVYAGVLKLSVDGVATNGFCIDPWHWSSGSALPYELESLANAPKSANDGSPNPMGASTALKIEQLWQQYYTDSISNVTAAALQIQIWQLVDLAVDNGAFKLLSIDGADSAAVWAAIAGMDNFLNSNPNAPAADLIAVTGRGQDYVMAKVPDSGTTAILLGLAFVGFSASRTKLKFSRHV